GQAATASAFVPVEDSASDEPPALRNTYLIQGAMIHTLTSQGDFVGDILIRSGKIATVAEKISLRKPVPVIEAAGLHAVPGLCDAQSFYLSDGNGAPSTQIQGDVLDAIDFFNDDEIEQALSRGITTLCLAPPCENGFSGRAAVVKLIPDQGLDAMILKRDVALKAGIGKPEPGFALARVKSVRDLAKALQGAREYQEAWADYREELEEYLKILEENRPKADSESKALPEGEKPPEAKDQAEKPETPETQPETQKEKQALDRCASTPALRERGELPEHGPKKGDGGKEKPDAAKKEDPEKEGPKKPQPPAYDVAKELLVKALEGETALHIEVHRAADILAALDLRRKYPVDLVLVGCTEGKLVIEEIKEAGLSVILGQVERPGDDRWNGYYNHSPDLAACFHAREIPFALSCSGGGARSVRYLALNAAQAVGHGLSMNAALESITLKPAEILGVAEKVGSLAKGKDADIVLFDKPPLESDARVMRVLINGVEVYAHEK
ncbi:MAG: amidohydrolase family protein, partial [Planctomycetota bacterium]